ncbi:MAG: Asp-tRNA(Asn)/Glu-tRNA(Gln) amidotransferase subunit GatC [Bacteroidales bacterium]
MFINIFATKIAFIIIIMIDQEILNRLAKASNLKFDEKEQAVILNDLNHIVSFIDQLNEIDVCSVSDFSFVNHYNHQLRKDQTTKFQNIERIKNNATEMSNNYFVVNNDINKERS